jgi:glycogen operon protein
VQDPWARAFTAAVDWTSRPGAHTAHNGIDSAPFVPRGVVAGDHFAPFDWGDDSRLHTAWTDSVIYEVHVKGATMLHPDIPLEQRGTYAGFAHPAFVEHLVSLGVTAVELLPIQQHIPEERLSQLGLTNYWGYNTLGFFAPHHQYAYDQTPGGAVDECKTMIKTLHAAGIEVILDVVYNHTCEGSRGGPVLSLRGLHGEWLYRDHDTTGCGNTLDLRQPIALALVMDSLRLWVDEYRVDGFRFDLASAMGRSHHGDFDIRGLFLAAVAQDPVVSQVKLIAEPWDVGPGGYQLGGFPAPWAEWNDRYRDLIRDHWRNAPRPLGAVARRITGSPDLFSGSGRQPWASINFVTSHDGFTMTDLVSYDAKHNEDNLEHNNDGNNDNRSWNHGVEGPTDDEFVASARARTVRNLLTTLVLSAGTPMLLGGDELGRTQHGNNNAYCLDDATSWIDWPAADHRLLAFTKTLIGLRAQRATLRRSRWLTDPEALWLAPDGEPMTVDRWDDPGTIGLTLVLRGAHDESDLAIVLHEGPDSLVYALPPGVWGLTLSTDLDADASLDPVDGEVKVPARTVAVYSRIS